MTFDGVGSTDADGTIVSYAWSDGATTATTSKTYAIAGTTSMSLTVTDNDGNHWLPLHECFLGPGKSAIDHHHALLTRLRFRPTQAGEGSAFTRVMRPQGVALPIISMAVRLRLDDNNTIAAVRISIGPAGPVPYLAEAAMELLRGGEAVAQQFDKAAETVLASVALRTSKHRATREYREEMIRTHLPLILARAAERARSGQVVPRGVGL